MKLYDEDGIDGAFARSISQRKPDGCEWNPSNDSPAYDTDEHYRNTDATMLVGADGQWRLCDSCAKLPRFNEFRTRKRIETKSALCEGGSPSRTEELAENRDQPEAVSGAGTPEVDKDGGEPERCPSKSYWSIRDKGHGEI